MHWLHPAQEAGWAWALPPAALAAIALAGAAGTLLH